MNEFLPAREGEARERAHRNGRGTGGRLSFSSPARILVISAVRVSRDGIACELRACGNVEHVEGVPYGAQVGSRVEAVRPTAVLLDASEPAALETARRLRALDSALLVVAFGIGDNEREILRCATAGVAAYLPREAALEDLVRAVESAARGELACSPRMAATLFREIAALAANGGRRPPASPLTPREEEIVTLIARGLSNKEIAAELCIGHTTVKNHVHNILTKLNARRRSDTPALLHRAVEPAV